MNRSIYESAVNALEYILLPVVFFLCALKSAQVVYTGLQIASSLDLIAWMQVARYCSLIVFNLLTGYFLLLSRRNARVNAQGLFEVMIPLVSTFWFLSYSLVESIPSAINPLFIAPSWYPFVALLGGVMSLAGQIFAIAGVLSLRESFGVVVKVNAIKTGGLYRIVRHPIYFAYVLVTIGFMLLGPKVFNVLVYVIGILLQIWRARIEERKLAAFSVEYRQYMTQVPFFWPDFKHIWRGRS